MRISYYYGNASTVKEGATLRNIAAGACPHSSDGDTGDRARLGVWLFARAVAGITSALPKRARALDARFEDTELRPSMGRWCGWRLRVAM